MIRKVFITGVNSFVGVNLANHLKNAGYTVSGSVRNSKRLEDKSINFPLHIIALAEAFDDQILTDQDLLIHAAHDYSADSFNKTYSGTIEISKLAKKKGVKKQIFISSYSACNSAITEYGKAKYELEEYFKKEGHTIIRPGLVVGNGGLFLNIIKMIKIFPLLPLPDGGKGTIPIISVSDLNVAIEKIVQRDNKKEYNLFNKELITLNHLLSETRKALKKSTLFLPFPSILLLFPLTVFKKLRIPLPVDLDNLKAFINNQYQVHQSHLESIIDREQPLESVISQVLASK